jgi:transposase
MVSGRLPGTISLQRSRTSADPGVTPRGLCNGILYVLTTGCTWHDVPANYGTKSTVHRYHLELWEKGVYQAIFLDLLRDPALRSERLISLTVRQIQRLSRQKGGSTGYDGYNKVNGNKLSALVDWNGLPFACTVSPANVHDCRLSELTLEAFEIPGVQVRPEIISADAAYDAREIRQYNRKRGIKTNIPVNKRSPKHPKRGRPTRFDPELYKKRSAIERFFSWIEAFKKIVPRYERYDHLFRGLIHLICVVMIGRVLG